MSSVDKVTVNRVEEKAIKNKGRKERKDCCPSHMTQRLINANHHNSTAQQEHVGKSLACSHTDTYYPNLFLSFRWGQTYSNPSIKKEVGMSQCHVFPVQVQEPTFILYSISCWTVSPRRSCAPKQIPREGKFSHSSLPKQIWP